MAITSVHILIQIQFEIVDNEDLQMYSNMFSSFYLFIYLFIYLFFTAERGMLVNEDVKKASDLLQISNPFLLNL